MIPVPPTDLVGAERAATELILECRELGPDCGASDRALADAFVTTAIAGAVLRGELDRAAVADAQLLDPESVEAWRALLPTPADEADGWVARWVDGPVPDDPFTPAAPSGPDRLRLRRGPGVVHLDVGGAFLFDGPALRVAGDALVSAGSVGILVSARAHGSPAEPLAALRRPSLSVGVGPRLGRDNGLEVVPYLGADAWSGGALGARLGLAFRYPLRWGLEVQAETSLGLGWAWTEPGEGPHVTTGHVTRLEWHPGSGGFGFGLMSFEDPEPPSSPRIADLGFGIGVTWRGADPR